MRERGLSIHGGQAAGHIAWPVPRAGAGRWSSWKRVTPGCVSSAITGVLLAVLAWAIALPGPAWPIFPGHAETFRPSEMRAVSGTAVAAAENRLKVWSANAGNALQVHANLSLDAARSSVLRYAARDFPATMELVFVWRRADSPDAVHSVTLAPPGLGTRAFDLSSSPEWRGRITEIGLAQFPVPLQVDAARAFRPFEIAALRIETPALSNGVRLFVDHLFAPRPWTQQSINSLGRELGHRTAPALLPLIVAMAVLVTWRWALRGMARPSSDAMRAVVAASAFVWLVGDGAWQVQLSNQNALSRATGGYGGVADAPLAASAAKAREWLARYRADAKVAVVASSSFLRTRVAYHLRPADVSAEHALGFANDGMPTGAVLIVHESADVLFGSDVIEWPEGRLEGVRSLGTFGTLRLFERRLP